MWEEAEKFLGQDKYLGEAVRQNGHCKLKPKSKRMFFTNLVDAIVQQQLSLKAAETIFGRIKEKFPGGKLTPERILALADGELRTCGLSQAKSAYVRDLAARVKDGRLELAKLDRLTDEKIIEELVAVKGIGVWTAQMFLMFTLGRPDVFPGGDLGLRNALNRLLRKKWDQKLLEKFARRWKPWRTIASWYIWATLDTGV